MTQTEPSGARPRSLWDQFTVLGAARGESSTTRIARRMLVLGGLLMSAGGVIWGVMAISFGRALAASIPFGYVALTALNLTAFARTRNFRAARFVQVFISVLLPFVFQWVLGGFLSSGTVMVWSMVSLIGAMTFSQLREALVWLALYGALTVISGLLDPMLAASVPFAASSTTRIGLLVLNLLMVSGIVFGLILFLTADRARAVASLETAVQRNEVLNASLASEVDARGAQLSELQALQGTLQTRSEELSASLARLHTAQAELVQREKLAALGQLVAGVAHEVNTPLGVVYTAVTMSLERVEELEASLVTGTLPKRQVLEIARALLDALRIASTNAKRAASLISDFKRIAVDQTSEAEQAFELRSYLDAVVQSLSPMLARAGVACAVSGQPVRLVSRPGVIAQIVTNLVQNAMLHAFPDGESDRRVEVRCRAEPEHAVIEVEDHGVGMTEEVRRHVFEPFFTTKRGAGGSGLGMHIVHEQAYNALDGALELDTAPGQGTRVALRIPLRPQAGTMKAPGPA